MGPELGHGTLDKLDIFLLQIVLLLQLSLIFYALLYPAQRLLLWMYDFCFNQGLMHGLQSELLRSSAYVACLILCLAMLVMYLSDLWYKAKVSLGAKRVSRQEVSSVALNSLKISYD
jgi:hypothetical protein